MLDWIWFNMGNAAEVMGRHDEAGNCFDRALAVSPTFTAAQLHRLASRLSLGFTTEAISGYREILKTEPQNIEAARRLLLALAHEPVCITDLFAEHQSFARRFSPPADPTRLAGGSYQPRRKIRVGYVSADLDETWDEIYASHVLEHVPQAGIVPTLKGLHRILKPDGKVMISVPDLSGCSLILK